MNGHWARHVKVASLLVVTLVVTGCSSGPANKTSVPSTSPLPPTTATTVAPTTTTTTTPRKPAVWELAPIPSPNGLMAVSCPSAHLCVAVDNDGHAVISTHPTGGAPAWKAVDIDGTNAINGVACPSIKLCVAVDDDGSVIISTKPTGGASKWERVDVDGNQYIYGVSCPTVTFCAAGDLNGNVVTSSDPSGRASKWKVVNIDGREHDRLDILPERGSLRRCRRERGPFRLHAPNRWRIRLDAVPRRPSC